MAGTSSSISHLDQNVDDLYFLALHDDDGIIPVSDEKYAEELQLQEALISSSLSLTPSPNENTTTVSYASSSKEPPVTSFQPPESLLSMCNICMDSKTTSDMFQNTKVCAHVFCSDCIRGHVAAKIKENVTTVKCPDPKCEGVLGPQECGSIVPKEVLERWEDILCESMIMGSQKFYCPFKDCSAMMVDDGEVVVTSSECPSCYRLFCAQCKVAWHCGMSCSEFESMKKGESNGDNLLMDLANDKKWMRCSKCKYFVERVDGCKHISCRCGHEFCYGCGEVYTNTHVCASG